MAQTQLQPVTMRNVRLVYRNFTGKVDDFNPLGKRKFNVVLSDIDAENMARDGWNVKYPKPNEDGETRQPTIEVEASYKLRPPKIFVITSRGKTPWGESEIGMLDWVDIVNVDIKLNPYYWELGGKAGIKAYLESLYITIEEDELDLAYADVPTIGGMTSSEDMNDDHHFKE